MSVFFLSFLLRFAVTLQNKMTQRNVKAKRELYCRRMQDLHSISVAAEQDAQSKLEFVARYPDAEKIAENFEALHLRVIQEMEADAEFDREDVIRAQFDRWHYFVKTKYHALTEASRLNATNSSFAGSASKVKLPKIALPRFSGDLALWPSFLALYNTSIHDNSLSDMEKYQYLLSSRERHSMS